MLDWIFLSSVVVAPLAVVAAIYFWFAGAPATAAACAIVAASAAWGIYARFVAPWQLRVKRLKISRWSERGTGQATASASRPPLKVVFFSDLHLGQFKRQDWAQRIVETVNAQSPDLILIGGDFVGKTACCEIADLLAPLRHLRATHGVYAVLGNHDYGIPGPDHSDELIQLLPQLNIRLLRNECVVIGDDVLLVGVDELWTGRDDLHGALAPCHHRAPAARTIVLGHNPDLMLKLDGLRAHPALQDAFFIFGHTHQGQIYIPLLPGLAVPIESKFYRGLHHTPHGALYVSSGCGENTTPTRLNTWPEIVVFEV
ncbi:MAG: metallophosphoesterase family protein [Anaerolineae bacterium]|nr:metallophosphoesterase family protein [Candidatus Roseilinea sp.]MDW8451358.1 metallophosphoesterase family protein [Anaerolineae bacterium]